MIEAHRLVPTLVHLVHLLWRHGGVGLLLLLSAAYQSGRQADCQGRNAKTQVSSLIHYFSPFFFGLGLRKRRLVDECRTLSRAASAFSSPARSPWAVFAKRASQSFSDSRSSSRIAVTSCK